MKIRVIALVMCLILACGCTACGNSADDAETTPTTAPTTPTTAVIIKEDLSAMLTQEEVTDAVGIPMTAPTVSGQGTMLTSVGVEDRVTLSVVVSEKPRDIFDQMLLGYPIIEACPNLGETAWFSQAYHQLLVYDHERMITVELIGLPDDDGRELLRCRQIAADLLEHFKEIDASK